MGLPYAKALPGEKPRSEEHTSELQSPCNLVGHLVISYAVFCLKKKKCAIADALMVLFALSLSGLLSFWPPASVSYRTTPASAVPEMSIAVLSYDNVSE